MTSRPILAVAATLAAALAAAALAGLAAAPAGAQDLGAPPPPCTALGTSATTCMQGADARVTSEAAVTGAVRSNGAGGHTQAGASDLSNGVTGSGAVVLKTSPSLITPNIGAATGQGQIWAGTAPALQVPPCAGATWLVGGDPNFCNHATTGGTDNNGVGTIVFQSLTTGFGNNAFGSEDEKDLTTGSYNDAFGFEALHVVTTGEGNVAIGHAALALATTDNNDVALGEGACSNASGATVGGNFCVNGGATLTTGNRNILFGNTSVTTGSDNLLIGFHGGAGYGITTGSGNVWIGGQGATLSNPSNSVYIADGVGDLRLDFDSAGNMYLQNAATISATKNLLCWDSSSGQVETQASSCTVSARRFKRDIVPLSHGLDWIERMDPSSCVTSTDGKPAIGVIADTVQEIDPRLAAVDGKGHVQTIEPEALIAVLVKAVQEQQVEITALQAMSRASSDAH